MAINKIIYGNNTLIDLTSDTVDVSNLLSGFTAHDKTGAIITGECEYDADTSDADASASEILNGKIAYANGNRLVGTMTNNGAIQGNITAKAQQYSIPSGYHDGSGYVQIDANEQAKIIASNIKSGVQILGVTGDYSGEAGQGQAKTVTPYTTAQTILPDPNYDYLTQVTVDAIAYVEEANAYGTTVRIGNVAP